MARVGECPILALLASRNRTSGQPALASIPLQRSGGSCDASVGPSWDEGEGIAILWPLLIPAVISDMRSLY